MHFFSIDSLIRYNQICPTFPMNVSWKHRMKVIILNYTTPIIAELDDKVYFFAVCISLLKNKWSEFFFVFSVARGISKIRVLNFTIQFTKANFTNIFNIWQGKSSNPFKEEFFGVFKVSAKIYWFFPEKVIICDQIFMSQTNQAWTGHTR